jgi:AcrR family transcriptional regulator
MAGPRKQVRGELLVARVMTAALAEMARVGAESLSIEEVAARAHVNKTTIYRRWPTPSALARDALQCSLDTSSRSLDTGTLRGDIAAWVREFRDVATSRDMHTLLRLRFGGPVRGPFATLTKGLEKKKRARFTAILRRAIVRGELPRGTDTELLHDVLLGTLLYMVVFARRHSDARRLERALHLILGGAVGWQESRRGARSLPRERSPNP